jgi:SAM-dependent methyltransferase
MSERFLDILGNETINNILADWQPCALNPAEDGWIGFPPKEFLDFVSSYPRIPNDSIPESEHYLKAPTFLIVQAHRLWLTASQVFNELNKMGAKRFIDLGSFPFFLPILLRDYFGYKNEIIVTANLGLSNEAAQFLESKQIQVMMLDLDPYVSEPENNQPHQRIPFELGIEKGSADFILASHVIEHLYHPISLLKECFRLIKPGGKLMITTDNAMMLDTFINYVAGYGYTFEPIEQTAAMQFHFWRGHTRFFTDRDLTTMVESVGFKKEAIEYNECFYDVFFDDYFKRPQPHLSGYKRRLLKKAPFLRNDITIIASKS